MLIGISGLAGSGKDTCADFLVKQHGFAKVSFGDPLKRVCRDVYNFSFDQLWGPSEMRNAPDERYPREHTNDSFCRCCGKDIGSLTPIEANRRYPCYLTPRFALQTLGTEWGRICYPNTWVDYALNVAKKLDDEGGYNYDAIHGLSHDWRPGDTNWRQSVVIPDVRFKNEIDGLRAAGAYVVRITRPNAGLVGAAGAHVSETEQSNIPDSAFDAVIRNDRGLRELEEAVTDLVRHWGDR